MGTRSYIHVNMVGRPAWAGIYCHWDGYWSHNGKLLFEHYNSQELAEALIALGDISSLRETIGEKHPFDPPSYIQDPEGEKAYRAKYGKMCTAFGRDRGEQNCNALTGTSLEEVFRREEYMYVWKDGQWWGVCYAPDKAKAIAGLRPLADILAEEAASAEEETAS